MGRAGLTEAEAIPVLRAFLAQASNEPERRHGRMVFPEPLSNGDNIFPYVELMPLVGKVLRALRMLLPDQPPFDWMAWNQIEQPQRAEWIAAADRQELAKLLLAIEREDRFVEGLIAGLFNRGLFTLIAERVLQLEESI